MLFLFFFVSLSVLSVIVLHNEVQENNITVNLELARVEMLALTGKAVEGDILTAIEVIPETETQQQVWSKYKKDIKYQWYCATF